MATPWERAQISSPVYVQAKRSRELVQRLRWGQRLQDASAEEQLLEDARRQTSRPRPASAPSARSGAPARTSALATAVPAAPPPLVSAVAAALACVPRTIKAQVHHGAHAQDVAKLRWHAAAAAAPLFKEQSTGLALSGRHENVHEVCEADNPQKKCHSKAASGFAHKYAPLGSAPSEARSSHGPISLLQGGTHCATFS